MQGTKSSSLSADKFLTVSVNLLNRAILEATRTDAKKIFRALTEGQTIALTQLELEDKSTVRVDLSLNHTLYPGRLNFRGFRTSLSLLLRNAVEALQDPGSLRTFRNEENPDSMLFGLTAVVVDNGVPSVMALGVESARGDASVLLQLSFLDPKQFAPEPEAAGGSATA